MLGETLEIDEKTGRSSFVDSDSIEVRLEELAALGYCFHPRD